MSGLLDRPPTLLRRALLADVLASGAVGVLLIVAAGPLEGLLDIPAGFLRWAGLILMPYVALVLSIATRDAISRSSAWLVIELNVIWTVVSCLALILAWIAPNALGYVFVIGQALVVALLGAVQYVGLRHMAATP